MDKIIESLKNFSFRKFLTERTKKVYQGYQFKKKFKPQRIK
jgi:hypothetical protein